MTSTSVTTVGGVTIVTQVIPKNDSSLPLQTAEKTTPSSTVTPPSSTKTDSLQVEPQCLGIVQIFVGVLCALFSLTAVYSEALLPYAPFILGIMFVASGSLAVAAGRRTSVALIWTSLTFNIISVLLGLAGGVYVCLLLASRPSEMLCKFQAPFAMETDWIDECTGRLYMLNRALYGLLGLLLVLLVLQVSVSVAVCVISGKTIKRCESYTRIKQVEDGRTLLDSDRC